MSELQTALSVILHEIENGEDVLDALNLAAKVIRDDRAKPRHRRVVSPVYTYDLMPRTVCSTGRFTSSLRCRDYVCPRHEPETYASLGGRRAYQIGMF